MRLTDIPIELLQAICNFLAQRDCKNLRLVCRRLKANVPLRIPRLFISPNRTNLDVFKSVIEHDKLMKGVQEIIWDDERLLPYIRDVLQPHPYDDVEPGLFWRFKRNVGEDEFPAGAESKIKQRKSDLWGEGAEEISLRESFRIY